MARPTTGIQLIAEIERHGSLRAAARALNIPKSTVHDRLKLALETAFRDQRRAEPHHVEAQVGTRYMIFSSAQDATTVHQGFLANLQAYASYLDASIHIAGYTYNKGLFEDHAAYRAAYHPSIKPYLTNERMEIAGRVSFCGEMNTLPTATSPLTGFETYTQDRWGIFPHAKVQLVSVATAKHKPTKILMTTGSVTLPNYIAKRAGIRAEFHHVIGAVICEITPGGKVFCRHLIAEEDGSFYDLGLRVEDGFVTHGHRPKAIVWGDLHTEKLDPVVATACFYNLPYQPSIIDTLRPKHQFIHDLADFTARNHHNIKDPHFLFERMARKTEKVEDDIRDCARVMQVLNRSWCKAVVVESNHDLALLKWLKTADYRLDPVNAQFFLEAQARLYKAIADKEPNFSIFEWAVRRASPAPITANFLRQDESYMLGDIEFGQHGHLGINGSRANPKQFTRIGTKICTGHTHSAGIEEGVYTAGVSGQLDMGYNSGPSSWSHSHILTYANGKRTIITMDGANWHG